MQKPDTWYAYFHVRGSFDPDDITRSVGVSPTVITAMVVRLGSGTHTLRLTQPSPDGLSLRMLCIPLQSLPCGHPGPCGSATSALDQFLGDRGRCALVHGRGCQTGSVHPIESEWLSSSSIRQCREPG